jgi:hypothetical protein
MRAGTWPLVAILAVSACTTVTPGPTSTASIVTKTAPRPTSTTPITKEATTTSLISPDDAKPLLVVGDWGSGTEPQGAVAGAMARFAEGDQIAAILTTGDNFYSDAAEFLLAPFDWAIGGGIEFWIAWGNHDVETPDRIEAVNDAFGGPPMWTSHVWGEAEVVILDSNHVHDEAQLAFLESEMDRIEAPTIVVFHHPALSCSDNGDAESIFEAWVPLFDEDVVLVLSGHDHNYQRFEMEEITYVVTGGGGGRLHGLEDCPAGHPERIEAAEIHHFLLMDQDRERIRVDVIDVVGGVIDSFDIPLA